MRQYLPNIIEPKWQKFWEENKIFSVQEDPKREKFYVLSMFPYPSGDGLHVGHPLGYIAADIVARYKMSKGYAVLHPMGFDAFGLPAEQYAIQTGQHPAITTQKNIERYIQQLKKIGFTYDWDRQVCTSDPQYYKWTQWIFLQLHDSWYDKKSDKARPISELIKILNDFGNWDLFAACSANTPQIDRDTWAAFNKKEKENFLLNYRLAFLEEATVNWCPELGTVLSNDEVKDGLSERGGFPVEKKKMRQWMMRISAYADRLLSGLDNLEWSEAIKTTQKHWIGKSIGANIVFEVLEEKFALEIFTTRPETIFGVTFMCVSLDHEIIKFVKDSFVLNKIEEIKNKSSDDLDGVFLNMHIIHPFTQEKIPVWATNYVLSDYGTGALMAVPAHDSRDLEFAKKFGIIIKNVVNKDGILENSQFLDGLSVELAREKILQKISELSIGQFSVKYRMRDAIFSRQRYWGEPVPIFYDEEGVPTAFMESDLPLKLPEIADFKPSSEGRSPLAKCLTWKTSENFQIETDTMPGWAGSSWYFFRYMDAHNTTRFVGEKSEKFWKNVDLYIGGSEHATGHLLYARFWTKFLYDRGLISMDEPFKKLVNQGMIQGKSYFIYRIKGENLYVSADQKDNYETTPVRLLVDLVKNDQLDIPSLRKWRPDFEESEFLRNHEGEFLCHSEVEKMSKSKFNVVSPDSIIDQYGADSLRLYTMFLGPLQFSKPWDMNGIDGVYKFLHKVWRLFFEENGNLKELSKSEPSTEELKVLHTLIKKVNHSMEELSFNTVVSSFMVCVNSLQKSSCINLNVLLAFVKLLAPFAPHICEEIWEALGNKESVVYAGQPNLIEKYLENTNYEYPISINGKTRAFINFDLDTGEDEIKKIVLQNQDIQKWTSEKEVKKIIVVRGRIVNIVL